MLQWLVCFLVFGYCYCTDLGSTFEYGGRVYTIYRNVSHTYSDATQYCQGEGHDGLADLCSTPDLTNILPPTHGKPLFWVTGPSTCTDVGNCLSLWYDLSHFPSWVVTCVTCDLTRNFICEAAKLSSHNASSLQLTNYTTTSPPSILSACTDIWTIHSGAKFIVSPLVLSYDKATRLCQSKYHGELMSANVAEAELSTLTEIIGTSSMSDFWLKETLPGVCNLVNSSRIVHNTMTVCSYVYGLICSRTTTGNSPRIAQVLPENTYNNQASLRSFLSTSGVMAARKARSLVDCASGCSVNATCQSFFFVSPTQLCQMHSDVISLASGQLTPTPHAEYYTKIK